MSEKDWSATYLFVQSKPKGTAHAFDVSDLEEVGGRWDPTTRTFCGRYLQEFWAHMSDVGWGKVDTLIDPDKGIREGMPCQVCLNHPRFKKLAAEALAHAVKDGDLHNDK